MKDQKNPFLNINGLPQKGKEVQWLNWERTHEQNPFTESDGSIKEGKEFEFFDWAQNEDRKRLDKLPSEIKDLVIKSQKRVRDRMQS